MMAAVSAIQPRSPLAAAATEAAAATRELGASAMGPGLPGAGGDGGDRWDASIVVQVVWQGCGGAGAQWWCLQQHLLDTDLLQDGR